MDEFVELKDSKGDKLIVTVTHEAKKKILLDIAADHLNELGENKTIKTCLAKIKSLRDMEMIVDALRTAAEVENTIRTKPKDQNLTATSISLQNIVFTSVDGTSHRMSGINVECSYN